MNWLYVGIAAVVLLVAVPTIIFAFSNPKFVWGILEKGATEIFLAILPAILKPETPEAREKRIEAFKRNEVPATKHRKHPQEGGRR